MWGRLQRRPGRTRRSNFMLAHLGPNLDYKFQTCSALRQHLLFLLH